MSSLKRLEEEMRRLAFHAGVQPDNEIVAAWKRQTTTWADALKAERERIEPFLEAAMEAGEAIDKYAGYLDGQAAIIHAAFTVRDAYRALKEKP